MSNREQERKCVLLPVEMRAEASRTIGGYGAVFNRLSQNLGGFVERLDPAFFNKARGDGWPGLGSGVMARYNHSDSFLLGSTGSGTLRLTVDNTGLDYAVDTPQTRADVYELVQRGDVRQSSFAFITYDDDWGMTDQGFPLRTLLSGQLVDVAPVNSPAYIETSVGLRSLAEKFEVEVEEVRKLAAADGLRKFFALSGEAPKAPTFGPAALAKVAALEAVR